MADANILPDAIRLVAEILAEIEPDKKMLLRLVQQKEELAKAFEEISLPPHTFAQRRKSNLGYPPGFEVLPVGFQVNNLIRSFPHLKIPEKITKAMTMSLPKRAEGNFVIPRPELIGSNYGEALYNMLNALGAVCGGVKLWHGYDEQPIKPTEISEEFFNRLENYRSGDFLIFPGQFGQVRAGWSAAYFEEARMECEYPLGAYAAVAAMLANGGPLGSGDQLGMICAGDNLPTSKKKKNTLAPTIFRMGSGIMVGTLSIKTGLREMGIPSAFLTSC